jgi:catechol 2,3-dioxygenase-like lactoylglutathione lyase family enzyme
MITALDRIKLQVADIATATAATERLLARAGFADEETAAFVLDNTILELSLAEDGAEGLTGLAFEVADAQTARRTCERRALDPETPVAFVETVANGAVREGHHVDLDTLATFGVPTTLVAYEKGAAPPKAKIMADGAVTGLDHIVIRTTHPDRAAALYGARLGLDMRLDRTEPKWGSRLVFFRCGDLIVEVAHNLNDEPSDAPDKLWGLSWRVAGIEAANARLKASGFDVSDIRAGRKPRTRVFTVRDNTLGVPTLMIEPARG